MSLDKIDNSLAQRLQSSVLELNLKVERTLQGFVAPNAETEFNLNRFRKDQELHTLAVISWYCESAGVLLREELARRPLSEKGSIILEILLSSKEECLRYLATYDSRNIFGMWIPQCLDNLSRLKFRSRTPKLPKRAVRRRGYKDHGSCRPLHKWLPTSDYSLTELQEAIESERLFRTKRSLSIQQFGLLGVRLPETEREF
jgi:hypothetical protein